MNHIFIGVSISYSKLTQLNNEIICNVVPKSYLSCIINNDYRFYIAFVTDNYTAIKLRQLQMTCDFNTMIQTIANPHVNITPEFNDKLSLIDLLTPMLKDEEEYNNIYHQYKDVYKTVSYKDIIDIIDGVGMFIGYKLFELMKTKHYIDSVMRYVFLNGDIMKKEHVESFKNIDEESVILRTSELFSQRKQLCRFLTKRINPTKSLWLINNIVNKELLYLDHSDLIKLMNMPTNFTNTLLLSNYDRETTSNFNKVESLVGDQIITSLVPNELNNKIIYFLNAKYVNINEIDIKAEELITLPEPLNYYELLKYKLFNKFNTSVDTSYRIILWEPIIVIAEQRRLSVNLIYGYSQLHDIVKHNNLDYTCTKEYLNEYIYLNFLSRSGDKKEKLLQIIKTISVYMSKRNIEMLDFYKPYYNNEYYVRILIPDSIYNIYTEHKNYISSEAEKVIKNITFVNESIVFINVLDYYNKSNISVKRLDKEMYADVNVENFPKIKYSDPLSMELGLTIGDVIEITTILNTASGDMEKYYRICKK